MFVYILSVNQRTPIRFYFGVLVFLIAGYSFCDFLQFIPILNARLLYGLQVSFLMPLGAVVLMLGLLLTKHHRWAVFFKKGDYLILVVSVMMGGVAYVMGVVENGYYSLLYLGVLGVFLFLPVLVTIGLLYQFLRWTQPSQRRRQCVWFLWGVLMSFSLVVLTHLLAEFVFLYAHLNFIACVWMLGGLSMLFMVIRDYSLMSAHISDTVGFLFRNLNDGILVMDNEGQIRHINVAGRQILDRSYADLLGAYIDTILDGDQYQLDRLYLNDQLKVNASQGKQTLLVSQRSISNWQSEMGKVMMLSKVNTACVEQEVSNVG